MRPDEETIYNLADFLGFRIYREVGTDGMPTGRGECILVDQNSPMIAVGLLPEEVLKEKLIKAARRKIAEEHRRIAEQNAATQTEGP